MAIELPQTVLGPFVSDGNIAAGFQPVRYTPGVLAVLEPFGEAAFRVARNPRKRERIR
jgi:hypothetical protein